MAKKKDFSAGGPPARPVAPALPQSATLQRGTPCTLVINLPHGAVAEFDFAEFLGQGFDDIVSAITLVMRVMVAQGTPEPLSVRTIASGGVIHWFRFCSERARSKSTPTLASIDRDLLDTFTGWLRTRVMPNGEVWSLNTSRTVYQKVKTILKALVDRKLIRGKGLFRRNPFPGATNINLRRNHIRALSDTEREKILRPLAVEVAQVFDGAHPGSVSTQIGLCAFAILLKTGLNPTPLLEIPRELDKCFISHPRVNRRILLTFKRRAGKHTSTPLEPAESRVVSLDIYKLCQRVRSLTHATSERAVGSLVEGRLWVYEVGGAPRGMSTEMLSSIANAFTSRHQLVRDDGTRLKMSSQLFRNTKLQRIWRASKGDLLATAHSGSNTPASAERYLGVTPDMVEEHRLAGEVLVDMLSAPPQRDATPHSGCKDAFYGDLAPKNGSPCVDFLSCFRCKSQVII